MRLGDIAHDGYLLSYGYTIPNEEYLQEAFLYFRWTNLNVFDFYISVYVSWNSSVVSVFKQLKLV